MWYRVYEFMYLFKVVIVVEICDFIMLIDVDLFLCDVLKSNEFRFFKVLFSNENYSV